MFSSTDPGGWVKQYGSNQSIRVKLLSIQLIGGGPGKTPRGATVRFQRSLFNKSNGGSRPLDNKIATVEFTYKQNLEMDDQNRIENPLGFWVTSYRVDDDYATAPPAEVPESPLAAQAPVPASVAPAGSTAAAAARPIATGSPDPVMGAARQ
jgi:type IV secretion system protein VirB8